MLVAPDKFKGSLGAAEVAAAMAEGVRAGAPGSEITTCPLADGGEGTLDALMRARGGELRHATIIGPLGEPRVARWLHWPDEGTAVVESAEAVGLELVPRSRRSPLATTSYGLGELVRSALDAGVARLVVALGGSATTDGGAGMAQALGVRFAGAATPLVGADVARISALDVQGLDARLRDVEVIAACDVDSPLTGPSGAALVYARQKGASDAEARALDIALRALARRLPAADPNAPRSGAAGGLGWGLAAFLGARLVSGADFVLDAIQFDVELARADWVLTGEGRLDAQSLRGKVVAAVAARAHRAGVPVSAIAGSVALSAEGLAELGLLQALSLVSPETSEAEAIARARELIVRRAGEAAAHFRSTRGRA